MECSLALLLICYFQFEIGFFSSSEEMGEIVTGAQFIL